MSEPVNEDIPSDAEEYLKGRGTMRRMSFDPRTIKILVVDDELVARFTAQKLLNKSGYQDVTVVESAENALKIIKEEGKDFHIIISDVKMPGMNGLEFLESLSKDPKCSGIPVIMMSALDELPLVYQCLQQGACDFLTKPIKQQMVQNLWQNVWKKRKEQRMLELYQKENTDRVRSEEELKQEISSLHEKVTEAITTPIEAISGALKKLLNDGNLTPSVQTTIADILRTMQESHVFRPAVEEFIIKISEDQLDTQSREWFKSEFCLSPTDSQPKKRFSLPGGINFRPVDKDNNLIKQLRSWDFDVWQITDDFVLFNMITAMFQDFGLFETYDVKPENFQRFLIKVREKYSDANPYHNFRHAFDVTHMCYLLLTSADASRFLGSMEVFALLLCGLLHDVDHPGLNNTYQVVTESELAVIYNDQSVLENYHCSVGYKLLKQFQIISGIKKEEKNKFRKLILECILNTDLVKHMKCLSDFESLMQSSDGQLEIENEDHRLQVTRMIMKAADLSNPGKPFHIAKYWAQMVQEEFFRQGDIEKSHNLVVSPFMDRENSSLAQMQINFAGFIVIPLFQSLAKLLPPVQTKIMQNLLDNRQKWTEILKAEQQPFE